MALSAAPDGDVPIVVSSKLAVFPPIAVLDRERYSRQVLFAGIGEDGQQRLRKADVALVGVGATGAALAGLLARAGVGRLTLIDRDVVEPSNLQRQMLFDEEDARAALPKAEAARRHLLAVNSGIAVNSVVADLVPDNIANLLGRADLVLDGTDNFESRYLLNEFCVREGKPWIYTAAVGAYAATMNVLPRPQNAGISRGISAGTSTGTSAGTSAETSAEESAAEQPSPPTALEPASWQPTACLSCLFPEPPGGAVESCETAGILGMAVNLAASLAATEALKFLTGQPGLMRRSLYSHNLWTGERAEVAAGRPRMGCEVCGTRRFRALAGEGRPHITLCGRNSVQIHEHHRPMNLALLSERLAPLGEVRSNGLLLRFSYPPYTLTIFPDGRALVQGTTDTGLARSLYARFIGT